MSQIDSFKHECIGIVHCPSRYDIVYGKSHREIPLYWLGEDAPSGEEWNAKKGDLLLGGGSGESAALRISIPEPILYLTNLDWGGWEDPEDVFHAYWSMNDAYVFGDGYSKLGWEPTEDIQIWLMEHIVVFILKEYPDHYATWQGANRLKKDGSIVRLPSEQEKDLW